MKQIGITNQSFNCCCGVCGIRVALIQPITLFISSSGELCAVKKLSGQLHTPGFVIFCFAAGVAGIMKPGSKTRAKRSSSGNWWYSASFSQASATS
ncbi:MAG: hypothetical protein IPI68_09315 [Chitinophagaceae bacterium]|nr:hypothetical protein [Chitinophagaceae bacterium]